MALDKIKIFESFIGTVAGAAVAMVSFWLQSEYKERQSIQNWFEEEYIAQAIDPASTFVSILQLHLQQPEIEFPINENFPLTPLTRIETLTGSTAFSDALAQVVLGARTIQDLDNDEKKSYLQAIGGIRQSLAALRKWALDKKVRDKSEIYDARLETAVKDLVGEVKAIAEQLSPI